MFTSVVLNPNFNEPIFVIVTFKEITLCIQNLPNILKVFAVPIASILPLMIMLVFLLLKNQIHW